MTKPPRLMSVLRLRCPYCGHSKLQAGGSFVTFGPGCEPCNYRYEREEGYFTGASWMVNFPVTSVTGFILAALMLAYGPDLDPVFIAAGAGLYMVAFGILFWPWSMAIWLYLEHRLHPLRPEDALSESQNPH